MAVLIGSYETSGRTVSVRLDMTSANKVWVALKTLDYEKIRRGKYSEDEVLFAIVDLKGKDTLIYGDMTEASRFTNYILTAIAQTNGDEVKTDYTYEGTVRVLKSEDSEYKFVTDDKAVWVSLHLLHNDGTLIGMSRVSARVNVKPENFNFDIEDAVNISLDNNQFKGVTVALAFPSKEACIAKWGMEYMWDPETGEERKNYKVLSNTNQLKNLCTMILPNVKFWALDWETNGFGFNALPATNPTKSKPVGLGMSWALGSGVYIPVDHENGTVNLDLEETMEMLKPFLEKIPSVGANIIYDLKVFFSVGIKCNYIDDVLLLWYNMDPTRCKYWPDLKSILELRLGVKQPSLHEICPGAEAFVSHFPMHLIKAYCCGDADHTLAVYIDLMEEIKRTDTSFKLRGYRQDIQVARHLFLDEYKGVHIDKPLLEEAIECAESDKLRLEMLMYKFSGQFLMLKAAKLRLQSEGFSEEDIQSALEDLKKTDKFRNTTHIFSPSKDEEVREVFFKIFGLPVVGRTKKDNQPSINSVVREWYLKQELKTGQQSVGKDWLPDNVWQSIGMKYETYDEETLLVDKNTFETVKYPIVYLFDLWKTTYGDLTKFFNPIAKTIEHTDGVYFIPFRIKNTDTYRITHRIQTLKGVLKRLIIPPPDHYNIGWDAAAIEVRDVCNQAGCTRMIEVLKDPEKDSHVETASMAFETIPYKITSSERKKTKGVIFGSIYGMSEFGLCQSPAYRLEVTEENLEYCRDMIATISRTIPEVFAYLHAQAQFALDYGFSINPDFRVRIYDREKQSDSSIWRAALNFPIQSHSAGVFREIYLALKKAVTEHNLEELTWVYMLIHDELQNYSHESIHPYFWCWIIYNYCVIRPEGGAPYFLGAGFGMTFSESKDDANELPFLFLEMKAQEWEDGKWLDHSLKAHEVPGFVMDECTIWMMDRYKRELMDNGLDRNCVDLEHLADLCPTYYILRRVAHFVKIKPNKWATKTIGAELVRLTWTIFHNWNYEPITLVDGTILTYEKFLADYTVQPEGEVLVSDALTTTTVPVLEKSTVFSTDDIDDLDDIDLDDGLDILTAVANEGAEIDPNKIDDLDGFSLQKIHSSAFDDDESEEMSITEYLPEHELYRAELVEKSDGSDKYFMSDRYESPDVVPFIMGKEFDYSKSDAKDGYKVLGQLIMVYLTTENYVRVVEAIKKMITHKTTGSYSVTLVTPIGEYKELPYPIDMDWEMLKEAQINVSKTNFSYGNSPRDAYGNDVIRRY